MDNFHYRNYSVGNHSGHYGISKQDVQVDYKKVRVQFKEGTDFQVYNGCYKIDSDGTGYDWHHAYRSDNNENSDSSIPTFGYCQGKRQLILFQDNTNNDTINPCTNTGEIIRSTRTDTYDISTSFEDSWYSSSGTPMDIFFYRTRLNYFVICLWVMGNAIYHSIKLNTNMM